MSTDWRGHHRGEPGYRRLVLAMFAAGFATFAQVFDAQAVLPLIAEDLRLPAASAAVSVSAATLGMALSVLPWTRIADRYGRTRAMTVSLVIASVIGVVAPLVPSFELFLGLRALGGMALGAVPAVAMAFLAEEIGKGSIAVAAGTYVAGNTIGGVLGRLVASGVGELAGWRIGLETVGAMAVLAGVVFIVLVPQPRGYRPAAPTASLARLVLVQLRDPVMLGLYAQGFLLMGAFAVMYNYLAFHLAAAPFRVPGPVLALLFLAYLAGAVAASRAARIAERLGAPATIVLGAAVLAVGALLTLAPWLPVIVLGLVLVTVGCFIAHPTASSRTGIEALAGRSQAVAIYQFGWLVGTALLGWLGGLVYAASGWGALVAQIVAQCALAALAAWAGLVLLRGRRPRG